MASLSFPPLLPPVMPTLQVDAVAAAAPVALLEAEAEALPLPVSAAQTASVLSQPGAADAAESAAMRPDQLMMARQLTWPTPDGGALASAWRGMVRNYGYQVVTRELQTRAGQLPAALLLAGQPGEQVLRGLRQDLQSTPFDAWRFTIHAGGARDQHLRVIEGEPESRQMRQQQGRRARAGLRLELVMEDGTVVTVQAEPVADGVKLELCAPDAHALARLRELQPQLDAAVRRAGLRVLGWTWRETLPDGRAHARLPSAEAASALSLPVFRAMAELALLLPAARAKA
jgi:hypothetical protein